MRLFHFSQSIRKQKGRWDGGQCRPDRPKLFLYNERDKVPSAQSKSKNFLFFGKENLGGKGGGPVFPVCQGRKPLLSSLQTLKKTGKKCCRRFVLTAWQKRKRPFQAFLPENFHLTRDMKQGKKTLLKLKRRFSSEIIKLINILTWIQANSIIIINRFSFQNRTKKGDETLEPSRYRFSRKSNQKIETISDILRQLNIPPPWEETRGPKYKYFFHTMKRGDIIKKEVPLRRARNIQTAMILSAKKQGFDVTIQNHGSYLLIRRNK